MSIEIAVHPNTRIVTVAVTGAPPIESILRTGRALRRDVRYQHCPGVLWDLTEGSLVAVDLQSIRRLARAHGIVAQTAIVVSTQVDFALIRMFILYRQDPAGAPEVQAFRDCSEARRWLEQGLPHLRLAG